MHLGSQKLGARMWRSHGDGEEGMVSLCSPSVAAGTPEMVGDAFKILAQRPT